MTNSLAIFEGYKIRRHYDEKAETWYFSVVDTVAALTDSVNARDYWFKMKIRVKSEDGIQLSTICRQLKMKAPDGKMRLTDCANVETLLRLIQSFPRQRPPITTFEGRHAGTSFPVLYRWHNHCWAKKADSKYTTLTKVESGVVNKPSVQTMAKIAKALGVSIENLIN